MPKLSSVVSKKHLKSICGLVLVLFALLICVPYGYVSRFLFFGMVFVFGNLFVFPLAFLFYYGIKLLFVRDIKVFHNFFIKLGLIFLFLGLSIILTYTSTFNSLDHNSIVFGSVNYFNNYFDSVKNNIWSDVLTLSNSFYSGGIIGYVLIAIFNLAGSESAFLSIVVSVSTILIILFVLFTFYKPLKKLALLILQKSSSNQEIISISNKENSEKTLLDSSNTQVIIDSHETDTSKGANFINENVLNSDHEKLASDESSVQSTDNENLNYVKVEEEQIVSNSINEANNISINKADETNEETPSAIKLNDQFENKSDVSLVTFTNIDILTGEEISDKKDSSTTSNIEVKEDIKDKSDEQNILFIQMSDALSTCNKLGKQFIDDFDSIYNNPKSSDVGSLIDEMKNLFNEIKNIKMAPSGVALNNIQLREWFFKSSTNLANLFVGESINELKDYETFINKVIEGSDIFSSLMFIEIFNLNKGQNIPQSNLVNSETLSSTTMNFNKSDDDSITVDENELQEANKLNSTVDLDETSIKKENNLSFDAKQSEDTYVKVDSPIAEEKKNNVVKNEEMVKTKNNVKSYNYEDFKPLSIVKFLQNIKDDENLDENKALAEETIIKINAKFEQLGVGAKAISYKVGPTVTRFDIQPNDGVPISSLDKYIDDISMALSGRKVRFEKIVFGKTTSSFEVSNMKSSIVRFYDVMKNMPPIDNTKLDICFGKDINDDYVICDLTKTPHMLVCGETGSGKSVLVQNFVISLMMRISPKYLKFIFIDPKIVEFNRYKDCPHLLCPPVTTIDDARPTIAKLCEEMDNRFTIFSEVGCVDISEYNAYQRQINGQEIPFIVLIIDEFADMVNQDKTVTSDIVRLASKARSAGIHMIVATQRPSADVISGLIKSNIPTRVALSVKDGTNSKIILDELGAENLLGHGDMLVSGNAVSKNGLLRVQSPLVLGEEIRSVIAYLKNTYPYQYDEEFLNIVQKAQQAKETSDTDAYINSYKQHCDSLYEDVKEFAFNRETVSISVIQRTFSIGFARAGKLFDMLVSDGIVESVSSIPSRGNKVLVKCQEQLDDIKNGEA